MSNSPSVGTIQDSHTIPANLDDDTSKQCKCNDVGNIIYDIIAGIISIADILTDIMVLIYYFNNDQLTFFWISMIIIIMAQLSYVLVFILRYHLGDDDGVQVCFWLFVLLPISPFLSFIFCSLDLQCFKDRYLQGNNYMYHICCLRIREHKVDERQSLMKRWMTTKLSKHVGFLLEAVMEAFPQSILQLTALVVNQDYNTLAIISILLSILSIASKSLILAAGISINIKTLIFTWICVITDFIGLFFVISWIFYDSIIVDELIIIIFNIFAYKLLICVVSFVFFCSIFCYYYGLWELSNQLGYWGDELCVQYVSRIVSFMIVTFLWAVGMILGTMITEILGFTYIAYGVYKVGHTKIVNTHAVGEWVKVIKWIQNARSYNMGNHGGYISRKRDKLIRLSIVNLQLGKFHRSRLSNYLQDNGGAKLFKNVTYKKIRQQSKASLSIDNNRRSCWINFKLLIYDIYAYYDILADDIYKIQVNRLWCRGLTYYFNEVYRVIFAFIITPLYILSRFVNMLYPYIIIIYISIHFGFDVLLYMILIYFNK